MIAKYSVGDQFHYKLIAICGTTEKWVIMITKVHADFRGLGCFGYSLSRKEIDGRWEHFASYKEESVTSYMKPILSPADPRTK